MPSVPIASPFDALYELPFVKVAMDMSVKVSKVLGDRPALLEQSGDRLPDEHEFYLLTVGNRLAHLLSLCGYLHASPIMLGSFRSSPELALAGIRRHEHIVFHAEGYLVRIGSLFDRSLRLVDAVFHLGNTERNCSDQVVMKNRRVAHHGDVVAAMKAINKIVDPHRSERNEVVHARSFMDQELRYAEMYDLAARSKGLEGDPDARWLARERDRRLRRFVGTKKGEFQRINQEAATALAALFRALENRYVEEHRTLKARMAL